MSGRYSALGVGVVLLLAVVQVQLVQSSDTVTYEHNGRSYDCILIFEEVGLNGKCENLREQGSCPANHWLLLSRFGVPHCAERRCPWDLDYYNGACVDPDHVCRGRGQSLTIARSGRAECTCGYNAEFYNIVQDPLFGDCLPRHQQGSCPHGFYLETNGCVPNPCTVDHFVLHDGACYEKNYDGYCIGSVDIDSKTNTADCTRRYPYLFQISREPCPPGSRTLYDKRCRSTSPRADYQVSSRVRCQPGYRSFRGVCQRIFSLPG